MWPSVRKGCREPRHHLCRPRPWAPDPGRWSAPQDRGLVPKHRAKGVCSSSRGLHRREGREAPRDANTSPPAPLRSGQAPIPAFTDREIHAVTDRSRVRPLSLFFFSALFSMKSKAGWVRKGICTRSQAWNFSQSPRGQRTKLQTHPLGQKVLSLALPAALFLFVPKGRAVG